MQYLGGKFAIKRPLVDLMLELHPETKRVWDPFCGGLHISTEFASRGLIVKATDINPALRGLYQAVANGWIPPEEVSREQWEAAKLLPDSNPMKAFAGFCCSFGGVYFCSYVPAERYSLERKQSPYVMRTYRNHERSSLKIRQETAVVKAAGGSFGCLDFCKVRPRTLKKWLIYCDPPYQGTKGYRRVSTLDVATFLRRAVEWARMGTPVFISEYALSVGEEVWAKSIPVHVASAPKGKRSVERLFYLRPSLGEDCRQEPDV